MSILVITTIDLNKSLTQRPHHMIKYLKKRGMKTTVLSASFENNGSINDVREDNVRYIIVSLSFADTFNPNSIYLPYSRLDSDHYDVCIAIGPWAGLVAITLKRKGRVDKLVYEDVDYFPAFFDYDVIYERVRQMERLCLNWADIVICVSEELMELRKYQTQIPVYFIPNGVDLKLFKENRVDYSAHKSVDLIYSGALEDWAGVEFAIRGMQKLVEINPGIRMTILGKGSKEKMLFQLVRDLSLEAYIKFNGTVKYEDLPSYFSNARIGVAVLKPIELVRYAFPLKVIEYMAAGLPVIGTDVGDMGRLLKGNNAGIAIDYSQSEFVKAVDVLLKDQEFYERCSENARKLSQKYDWNCLFDEEFDIINV